MIFFLVLQKKELYPILKKPSASEKARPSYVFKQESIYITIWCPFEWIVPRKQLYQKKFAPLNGSSLERRYIRKSSPLGKKRGEAPHTSENHHCPLTSVVAIFSILKRKHSLNKKQVGKSVSANMEYIQDSENRRWIEIRKKRIYAQIFFHLNGFHTSVQ